MAVQPLHHYAALTVRCTARGFAGGCENDPDGEGSISLGNLLDNLRLATCASGQLQALLASALSSLFPLLPETFEGSIELWGKNAEAWDERFRKAAWATSVNCTPFTSEQDCETQDSCSWINQQAHELGDQIGERPNPIPKNQYACVQTLEVEFSHVQAMPIRAGLMTFVASGIHLVAFWPVNFIVSVAEYVINELETYSDPESTVTPRQFAETIVDLRFRGVQII